ncbi:MAG: hypothetical protein OXM01_08825 [Gemmatimonadota bacterium]|nr:hypothetical protein [Gemmatimonadota bacterium]
MRWTVVHDGLYAQRKVAREFLPYFDRSIGCILRSADGAPENWKR